jgi:hypothetical protein
MARISLWNPNKTNDYRFFDRQIREQFHIGGTGAIVHKFVGPDAATPGDPSQPDYQNQDFINETTIQDLLFLENRDRKYDSNIYELRGVYQVSDNDFDLSQFGLFLTNDVFYMTFHTNEMVEILGRRLMNGDVIELPHLLDEYSLDANSNPIPKFYVVKDGNKGSEGYSPTWRSHIWRVKLGPLTDSQEFDDILGSTEEDDSLKNMLSSYQAELNITDAIIESAGLNDPVGGGTALVDHLYNFIDDAGEAYYHGGVIASGHTFPATPNVGDFFIRSDFTPNRMFIRQDSKWIRIYDNVENEIWSDRTFNAATFINNDKTHASKDHEFDERISITDVLKPKPDY